MDDPNLPRRIVTSHTDGVCGCAFSPDGHQIASANDKTLTIRDTRTASS
jgi:WD40 repeat protein